MPERSVFGRLPALGFGPRPRCAAAQRRRFAAVPRTRFEPSLPTTWPTPALAGTCSSASATPGERPTVVSAGEGKKPPLLDRLHLVVHRHELGDLVGPGPRGDLDLDGIALLVTQQALADRRAGRDA